LLLLLLLLLLVLLMLLLLLSVVGRVAHSHGCNSQQNRPFG
jgi:hypothetical protein